MSMVCSAIRCCREEKDMIVGTSTNCSARRGRRRGQRCGIRSGEILGTAITCSSSAGASIFWRKSSTCSPPHLRHRIIEDLHEGRQIHEVRHGLPQNPLQWPHLNQVTAGQQAHPLNRPAYSTLCLPPWVEGSSGPWRCSSRSPPPLLLPSSVSVGLCGATSQQGPIATVTRSCRNMQRSRRSLRRWAALLEGCPLGSSMQVTQTKKRGHAWDRQPCCCC